MHIDLEWLVKIAVIGGTIIPIMLLIVKVIHQIMTRDIMDAIEELRADTTTLKAQNRRREVEQQAQKERTAILADLIQEIANTPGDRKYRDRMREIDRGVNREINQINIDHDEEQRQIKDKKPLKK